MSEMQAFLKMQGNLGLHVQKFPSGKYGFVGSVPASLLWIGEAKDIEDARKFGAGLLKRAGKIQTRVWNTADDAWKAAEEIGCARCSIPTCSCNA